MDNTEAGKIIVLAIIILILLGGFLLLLFLIFLKKKNLIIHNKEQAELNFKKELIKTQTEIQKETMHYIGREIHDNVGQQLTLSSLYLQQLVFENKAPVVSKEINNINTIIEKSLTDLRQLSKSLTDDTIQHSSIVELIEKECDKINDLKSHKIFFKNNLKSEIKSYQTKSIMLRIVQEFIQNSIKHAQCKKIKISISSSHNYLQLVLDDDGKGFETNNLKSRGIGLKNIKKRVELLKGNSTIKSNKKGTSLIVNIPL